MGPLLHIRIWKRQFARALSALIIGLLLTSLTSCERPQPRPLTVGVNPWVGYDPLVLAREKHMLDPGLVKVVELSSSAETLRFLRNGLLDAGALTLDEVLRLAEDGIELRVIAVLDTSNGADLVMAGPDITDLTQLKGATIAIESSTVGALVLKGMLDAAHLQPEDVTALNIEGTQHLTALKSHRVKAAVTYEPMAGVLRAAGYRSIFDSRQMPGEIVDVLVVLEDAARERPNQVDELLSGWARGSKAMQLDPTASANLLAAGVDLSPSDYLATFGGLTFYTPDESLSLLAGTPPGIAPIADRVAETLQELGQLKNTPNWKHLLDTRPAQRAKLRENPP